MAVTSTVVMSSADSSGTNGTSSNSTSSVVMCARTKSASDGARFTLKSIVALFAATENTALALEVGHADSWESGGGVVLSSVVVNFVNRHSGVYDVRLNGLLVDNRLDCLMNVVMDVLALNGRCHGFGLPSRSNVPFVLKLSRLLLQTGSYITLVAVVVLFVLDTGKIMRVLLWQNLAIVHGLNGSVIVVLVNLLVDCGCDVLVSCGVDGFACYSRSNFLVNSGVMVTSFGHEVTDGGLSFLHCDSLVMRYLKFDGLFLRVSTD